MSNAIEQLSEAVTDERPSPSTHREIMARHRAEWPTLWAAIDRLLVRKPGTQRIVIQCP